MQNKGTDLHVYASLSSHSSDSSNIGRSWSILGTGTQKAVLVTAQYLGVKLQVQVLSCTFYFKISMYFLKLELYGNNSTGQSTTEPANTDLQYITPLSLTKREATMLGAVRTARQTIPTLKTLRLAYTELQGFN